ncbi:Heat shock protein Hsp20 [Metarhizium brunneum]
MAFFPRAFFDNSHSFTPLFRLLDDFDNYSRQGTPSSHHHDKKRAGGALWQPAFDVRESGDSYELHGELPGLAKENVHIEFAEPQTLIVRGRSERSYTSGTPHAGTLEQSNSKGAIAEDSESSPHKATVENADQADAQEKEPAPQDETAVQKTDKKESEQGVKYWLSERSVGEFSRTFNFPTPVDQGAVTASFKDGILSVVVPKAKKQASQRIAIN